MAIGTVEERLAVLEAEVAQLKRGKKMADKTIPWWERRFGAFKDDPMYEEAERLGTAYRRSQPMPGDEDVSA